MRKNKPHKPVGLSQGAGCSLEGRPFLKPESERGCELPVAYKAVGWEGLGACPS